MEGQFSAGNVAGYEVTQARIALATTRLALQDGSAQYSDALTQLAGTLGLPRHGLDQVRFSFDGMDSPPAVLEASEIRRRAMVDRADIRGALAEYAASQAALQLDIANQYPDIHLGPGYSYNSGSAGDNQWQLSLSLNLPIFNHNQGPVAEATAKRRESAAHFLAVQAQAIGEIDGALVDYQVALQQMATADALRADLRKRYDSISILQHAGETDALAAHAAEIEYYSGALARLDALMKARQSLGQLEDAVEDPAALSDHVIAAAQSPSFSHEE